MCMCMTWLTAYNLLPEKQWQLYWNVPKLKPSSHGESPNNYYHHHWKRARPWRCTQIVHTPFHAVNFFLLCFQIALLQSPAWNINWVAALTAAASTVISCTYLYCLKVTKCCGLGTLQIWQVLEWVTNNCRTPSITGFLPPNHELKSMWVKPP